MKEMILEAYRNNHVFPLIDSIRYLDEAVENPGTSIIVLGSVLNVMSVRRIVKKIKDAQKMAIIDLDLILGLSSDDSAVQFLICEAKADGIISRQRNAITYAQKRKAWGMFKVFSQDLQSVNTAISNMKASPPDSLDIIPGIAAPFALEYIREVTDVPVSVSGFFDDSENSVRSMLNNGVDAIHTRNRELWGLKLK